MGEYRKNGLKAQIPGLKVVYAGGGGGGALVYLLLKLLLVILSKSTDSEPRPSGLRFCLY